MRVEDVPDPTIQAPTDAIIEVTTTGLCGSDLHLYETFGAFLEHGMGAQLFGCTDLYGSVPGGQAQYLRMPLEDAASAYAMFQAKEDDAIKVVFTP
ncbi:hypothetical protein [Aeromicrobium alkaliterrae]|uniref:Alcohol dehydrogenase N-terminal domain-containing protein n=1 Tax=Aeromicrobium alkaliterrae TaxID=302168 RepID=A0ABP4W843_9ACTN